MPLMSFAAAVVGDVKEVSITDALVYSALGFAIVFAVLLVLMAFIGIMSKALNLGSKEPKAAPAPVSAPVPQAAPKAAPVAVSAPVASTVPEGAMFVTLDGKKHTVSVTEKLPRFSVTLNGKTHAVDVEESVEEAAE